MSNGIVMDKLYELSSASVFASNDIYLYGEVDKDMGIYLLDKLQCLEMDMNNDSAVIRINSSGGDVTIALSIANAIMSSPLNITTIVDGWACSSALLIAVSGNIRQCIRGSVYLWHKSNFNYVSGTTNKFYEIISISDILDDACNKLIAKKSNRSKKFWDNAIKDGNDAIFSAEEAVELGLADSICK